MIKLKLPLYIIMKLRLLLINFLLFVNTLHSQQLKNILEGYAISKMPTNSSIVGSKWVSSIGATTEGINETELTISQSFNEFSLDKENKGSLSIALLSNLGLSGFMSSDIKVIFNQLEVYTLKDLYKLPLVRGEKVVFSSIKVASYDLEFDKKISANVMAKMSVDGVKIEGEVDYGNSKRITIKGANLFIAHKIVKIGRIETATKSKNFKNGSFSITDLQEYDFTFNVNQLVNKAIDKAIENVGIDKVIQTESMDHYIDLYARIAPITINILSASRGTSSIGVLNKSIDICYCELIGADKKLYPINITNTGEKIVYDYLFIDEFRINYSIITGVTNVNSNRPVGFLLSPKTNKISVISKTYYFSMVVD